MQTLKHSPIKSLESKAPQTLPEEDVEQIISDEVELPYAESSPNDEDQLRAELHIDMPDELVQRLEEVEPGLDAIRERPDVVAATDEYLSENIVRLEQLEDLVVLMDIARNSEALGAVIEAPITEEFTQELVSRVESAVRNSEQHQLVQEQRQQATLLQEKYDQIPQSIKSYYGRGATTAEEVQQAAKVLDVKVARLKYKLSKKYRDDVKRQVRRKYDGLTEDIEMSKMFSPPSRRPKISQWLSIFKGLDLELPEVDLHQIDSYEQSVTETIADFRNEIINRLPLDEKSIDDLAQLPDKDREQYVTKMLIKALENAGINLTKDIQISSMALSKYRAHSISEVSDRERIINGLVNKARSVSQDTFVETSLPIYYIAQDQELAGRLERVSMELNKHLHEEDDELFDLRGQLDTTFEAFVESIDRSNTLYWHATPVLDRIIKSGKLMPRVQVPFEDRVTNTGTHSRGIHFGRENFDYLDYSRAVAKPDIEGGSKSPAVHSRKERKKGISGVIVPLGILIRHASVRDEKSTALPSLERNPTRRKYEDNDVVFFGDTDSDELYEYKIPLTDCYITVSEDISEETRNSLKENGYEDEWIEKHLIIIDSSLNRPLPVDYSKGVNKFTLINSERRVRFANDNEGGIIDKKTGRKIRLGTFQDRATAYVSRRIKEQLLPYKHVIPLRVLSTEKEIEHTDSGLTHSRDINTHSIRSRRRTKTAIGYNFVEKLIEV